MSVHTPNQGIAPYATSPAVTRAMALNLAEWHASSVQHFGVASHSTDTLWWREPGGSGIYLGALIHDGARPDAQVTDELCAVERSWAGESFGLYDCWGTHDLSHRGYTWVLKNPWYLREPAAPPALKLPDGIVIEIVETPQQLADFERASWEGFEEPADPDAAFVTRAPYSQHPADTLADRNMYYLNARLEGEVVAGVIVYATAEMMGVYGISTLPRFRRRGYASALMRAAVALRPELPMCVFPDPDTQPIYTVLGFVAAGDIAIWNRGKGH